MALHITNQGVERKVRMLAAVTGESMTDAIGAAVDQRLSRVQTERAKPQQETVESIQALAGSFGLQPINSGLTEDEIMGYGPNGYSEPW